jgi:hypothetical protein
VTVQGIVRVTERRVLSLKGMTAPVSVRVLRLESVHTGG